MKGFVNICMSLVFLMPVHINYLNFSCCQYIDIVRYY